MPQATPELRHVMLVNFGSEVGDEGPIKFLENAGYVLNRNWTWKRPTPFIAPTELEALCILFLIEEWDFGGLEEQA